jgi:hypothetical protein
MPDKSGGWRYFQVGRRIAAEGDDAQQGQTGQHQDKKEPSQDNPSSL